MAAVRRAVEEGIIGHERERPAVVTGNGLKDFAAPSQAVTKPFDIGLEIGAGLDGIIKDQGLVP